MSRGTGRASDTTSTTEVRERGTLSSASRPRVRRRQRRREHDARLEQERGPVVGGFGLGARGPLGDVQLGESGLGMRSAIDFRFEGARVARGAPIASGRMPSRACTNASVGATHSCFPHDRGEAARCSVWPNPSGNTRRGARFPRATRASSTSLRARASPSCSRRARGLDHLAVDVHRFCPSRRGPSPSSGPRLDEQPFVGHPVHDESREHASASTVTSCW